MVISYKKHISTFEKAALVIVWLLLALSVAAQLFYGGGILTFVIALLTCDGVLSFLILSPLRYEFEEEALVIVNFKPMKSKRISYKEIQYYDTVGSYIASKIDFDSTEVLITYKPTNSHFKKTVSCHPKNVTEFVKTLRQKCPEAFDV